MSAALCTSVRLASKSDGYKIMRHGTSDGGFWHIGSVRTPHGFVAVYADEHGATLQIIIDSHEHEARIEKPNLRPRYLVTLARRFAEEVSP